MIKSSEDFYYNGHYSTEFHIKNVNIDDSDSMLSEPLFSTRTLTKEKLKYRSRSYFQNIQPDNKQITLSLAFENGIEVTNSLLRAVQSWLLSYNGYKDLWFLDDCKQVDGTYDITKPRRIYKATIIESGNFYHFGMPEGYIGDIKFETNSPYCYSSERGGDIYNLNPNTDENSPEYSIVNFFNHGDFPILPQMKIIVGVGDNEDSNNLGLTIIGKKVKPENVSIGKEINDGFNKIFVDESYDFSKYPIFQFKKGSKASGFFQLVGTVYYGEKFILGDYVYEFDLGYGKPYNKNDTENILVPVYAKKAHNRLVFDEGSIVEDASTVTIGDQIFEFDSNDIYSPSNVKVDISKYMGRAKGILHLNSNLTPEQKIKIGDITYTAKGGTREDVIKMTDHLLSDFSEDVYNLEVNRESLETNTTNVSTKQTRDITTCLVRNITRNPSDLGIRKMGYINKDFVWVLNDGESGTDYDTEIDDVSINDRVVVAFNEPIDKSTVNSDTIQVRDSEGMLIDCTYDISTNDGGKTVGIIPTQDYEYDSDYFVYVSPELKKSNGEKYTQTKRIKFHTKKEGDTSTERYENVPVTKTFYIYSASKIDSSTINDYVYVTKSGSFIRIDTKIQLINGGKTIEISPKTKYEYNEDYTVHVEQGLKDVDGKNVLTENKLIYFTTAEDTNITHADMDFIPIGNVPISETIKIPFDGKLDSKYVDNSIVGRELQLLDGDNNEVNIDVNISPLANNVLDITPKVPLNYNSYYFLYISQAMLLEGKNNILAPLRYKLITETEEYATQRLSDEMTDSYSEVEKGNKSALQDDYTDVNIDKTIVYHTNYALDPATVNSNNIWVMNSEGEKVNAKVEPTADNSGIQIFPIEPQQVWERGTTYHVYANSEVKKTNKPRIFAGSVPPDGDYENAVAIFGEYFDVIKTNGYTVQGSDIYDTNGNKVVFQKDDILMQNTGGLETSDFNDDGTVKDGTVIISIPDKGIITNNAQNLASINREKTKENMQNYMNRIKDATYTSYQIFYGDTEILTFTTKEYDSAISINIDSSIFLPNTSIKRTDIKKIKGMIPGDDIYLYEHHDKDFKADPNALIPSSIPVGAKVYAGKSPIDAVDNIKDDYTNAVEILAPLGYTIIDSTSMTLDEKRGILFRPFDLVIGGVLAGTIPTDFDPTTGNLLTSVPSETNPDDTRVTRVTGIPMEINIYPAQRLQGSAADAGRKGTLAAMQEFRDRYEKEKHGGTDNLEYESNICPHGITLVYSVPEGSNVYGAGTDYYNAIKYLNGFGFANFINVGMMTDEEKSNIGFTKNDVVVGGMQATDTAVTSGGETVTVKGIGAISLNGATRLGGKDRYETEQKIKEYSEGLKIKTVAPGDIVKLQITINNEENLINNHGQGEGDTPSLNKGTNAINQNTKIEYHIVKSVTELANNKTHIDFYESIRNTNYISAIEVTDLYKMYDEREAEDYLFDGSYQFKIENDIRNTLINFIKAINNTGTYGVEYSQGTYKHPMVLAQLLNENEMELGGLDYGSKYNIPISLIDKVDPGNHFLTPTLEGGKDCTCSNAIIALSKTIEEQNDKKERYNKDQYNIVDYDSNTLTIEHKMCGKRYNDIICLANVNQQYQTPYLITNDTDTSVSNTSLVNLQDFLTREKQIAKWDNETLIGGEDPTAKSCITALKNKITNYDNNIDIDYATIENSSNIDYTKLNIVYKEIGEIGNIYMNTSCVNGKLSAKKLSGGLDGLHAGETLIIDNENQKIVSDSGKDRYKNFNNNWLEVPLEGVELSSQEGTFTIQFAYRETYNI